MRRRWVVQCRAIDGEIISHSSFRRRRTALAQARWLRSPFYDVLLVDRRSEQIEVLSRLTQPKDLLRQLAEGAD